MILSYLVIQSNIQMRHIWLKILYKEIKSCGMVKKYYVLLLWVHLAEMVLGVQQAIEKTIEQNKQIVLQADNKIELIVQQIKQGKYPKDGITIMSHLVGLFGQRLWFYRKTQSYTDKLKINENCIGCGLCVSLCPMNNISICNGKAIGGKKCTMCYRCISHCPKKAITLLGKGVKEQCYYEKYS